jgi:hypothetical protein
VEATRAKDIDRYMQSIPADIAMQDKNQEGDVQSGRAPGTVLQQWSIVKDTVLIFNRIDQIDIQGEGFAIHVGYSHIIAGQLA